MQDDGLAAVLGDHASRHSVPGAAIAILRDGQLREAHWGVASVANGEPVSAETQFAIGSLTKPVTAAVLAKLAAAGHLSFDQPVSTLLQELRGSRWASRATVRDLLANRSHLPLRAGWEFKLNGEGPDALQRCAALVAGAESAAPIWSYSNLGWCLAGCIIERTTGRSWEDATRKLVLEPAEMTGTTFALSQPTEPRAEGHRIVDGQPSPVAPWNPRVYSSSGTSLLSTVVDLTRFATWQFEEPSCRPLREPHAEVAIHGWLDAWCLGWARFDWVGASVLGWDGLLPGQRAVLRILPDERAAIALLMNSDNGRAMYRSMFAEHLHEWLGVEMPQLHLEPSPGAAGQLDSYAGTYTWPDRQCRVVAEPDRLLIDVDGRRREAHPTTEGVFVVDPDDPDNPTVTFGHPDEQGRSQAIHLMLWALPRTRNHEDQSPE